MEEREYMQKNLYILLGKELRALFKDLKVYDASKRREIHLQMDQIVLTCSQIGGTVLEEAKQLVLDIDNFLEHPENPRFGEILRKHALRLEQETRDL